MIVLDVNVIVSAGLTGRAALRDAGSDVDKQKIEKALRSGYRIASF